VSAVELSSSAVVISTEKEKVIEAERFFRSFP